MINQSTPNTNQSIPVEIIASRNFIDWLESQQISLAFTTYQSSRLMFLGVNPQRGMSGFERIFDRAMGLYATPERIYLSSRYQIWQLDNVLLSEQLYDGYDKLYIPRISYTTGDLDIHDLAIENLSKRIIFISTMLNCLATVSDRHSCIPLWKPSFISALVNEDRCHLNGLALVDGKARYVTACSQSDVVDGWRDRRQTGGCVIDIQSNEVIATGLSMPHSPRFYQGKLWLLNAGTGYFGYIDQDKGIFEPVTFCPGFLRGLAFVGNYAIVGLSKNRGVDKTFSGLILDDNLMAKEADPRCGLLIIDLKTGEVVHWIRLEGEVTELYDIQVLEGVKRPQALGFQNDDISKIITLDPISPLVGGNLANNQPDTSPADTLYQQAYTLQKQVKLEEAIALYQQLINQSPQYAAAWHQLGVIMDSLGQIDQAILAYKQALLINPNYAETHNNLGIIAVSKGNLDEAIICFNQAIRSNQNYAFAENNLGLVLQMQDKLGDAAVNFQEAIRKNPNYPEARLNLGNVLQLQGKIEEAIAYFQTAIKLNPKYIKAYNSLALALGRQDKVEAAMSVFKQALAIQPNSPEAFACLFSMKEMTCNWETREADLIQLWQLTKKQLQEGKSSAVTPFDTLYKPWSASQQLKVACNYAQEIKRQLALGTKPLNFNHSRTRSGRLKIGYLCHDFRNHPTSHLMQSVFGLHDRNNFEIIAYSYGPDDGSEYRRRIANDCDRFYDIATLSITESAQRIFDDGVHILVDLMGYIDKARTQILALKPAPIQVNYLVYPGTMGADFIDYIIGDAIVTPPESADNFTEKLVILPDSYQANDYQQIISSKPVTRSQYGLPESGFVFCCFNHTYKIEPQIFTVWMEILANVPGSVLWLFSRVAEAEANLRREAQARGIEGDRLIFAHLQPKSEHLARHQLADLFLDTLYYNAHTTGSDALWAGLPIITCLEETFPSRVGASLLTAIGLPELITKNLEEYKNLAINLAKSPDKLHEIKQKLAQNRLTYPLFDTLRFTSNLEKAYRTMWDIYAAGKSPEMIRIAN
ncbi:TIGR03032 family protein [Microcystis aeruginosa]|uniref:TIGR03032 family protein n=1 Tax=Microcystis aeruginosa TaxID=1126 RepID=UPI000D7C76E3|nr:TIGR03032 family protein [Microcystis aeruginosa]